MSDEKKGAAPEAATTDNQPTLKNPKDKECPYCKLAFTSSSLGRHLDCYIREHNPKEPDGVHDVEEIRKLRGNITRRNMGKKDGSRRSAGSQSISGEASTLAGEPSTLKNSSQTLEGKSTKASPIDRTQKAKRDRSRQRRKAALDLRRLAADDPDAGKAAELALKDVLGSLRRANAQATQRDLFDFDPYTLSFPSLCLRILPAPPTLFSPTPFPTNESWSICPPSKKQFDALNSVLRQRLVTRQHQRLADSSPLPTPPLVDDEARKLLGHLENAFNHWNALGDDQREETWRLELQRAYVQADRARQELKRVKQELEDLKAGLECPLPNCERYTALANDMEGWDYDRLINKWKSRVKEGKANASGKLAQKPLPNLDRKTVGKKADLRVVIPSNPYASAPPTTAGTAPSIDLAREGGVADAAAMSDADGDSESDADADGEADADADADADVDVDIDMEHDAASEGDSVIHQTPSVVLHPSPQQDTHHLYDHGLVQSTPQLQLQTETQAEAERNHAQLTHQVQVQAQAQAHAQAEAQAQAHAHAQVQAQVHAWAAAQQQRAQGQSQHFHVHGQLSPHPLQQTSPHHHQQLSPHPSHMGSAPNSRRGSHAFIEGHMNTAAVLPMDGMNAHAHQYLPMGMQQGMQQL